MLVASERKWVWTYLETCRPIVVVMSPPCRGMRGYVELNRVTNPETAAQSYYESAIIGDFCADIADFQDRSGRFYFNEHPERSLLYERPKWVELASRPTARWAVIQQCKLGLVAPRSGLPVRKSTDVRANDERLLWRLRRFVCCGDSRCPEHHIIDGSISQSTQIWPWKFAEKIADGCADVIRDFWEGARTY